MLHMGWTGHVACTRD